MNGTVDNGRNVAVSTTFHEGRGGLVKGPDGWRLALQCKVRPSAANWKQGGTIEGARIEIASIEPGAQGSGMFLFAIAFPDGEPTWPGEDAAAEDQADDPTPA